MSHNFAPIISEAKLQSAFEYVADNAIALARVVLKRELTIDTLCFFAQSPEEHAFLEKAIRARGSQSDFTHGPTLYVDTDFAVAGQRIMLLGVRAPDQGRPEVGYADYPIDDYTALLKGIVSNPYAHEISSGLGQPLIELRHPDFDVRGYAFDVTEHS